MQREIKLVRKNVCFPLFDKFKLVQLIIQINTKMQILICNNRAVNKENASSSPQKQIQKMKVQLNDRIFQYHKLEEDYAQDKAKLMMQFHKQKVSLNRAIKQLKDKNIADNEEWTKKIDQIRREKEESLASVTNFFEQQVKNSKEQLKRQAQLDFQRELKTIQKQNQTLKLQRQTLCKQWNQQKQNFVKDFKMSLKRKEQQKDSAYNILIQVIKKQYEQKILQLQLLYLAKQQSLHRLQRQMEQTTKENVRQKLILQNLNRELQSQIQQLSKCKLSLEETLRAEKASLYKVLLKHQQVIKSIKVDNDNRMIHLKEDFQLKLNQNIEFYKELTGKYEAEVAKLESIHKMQAQLWEERGKKMLELYQKRESKKEDIKTIESLEVQLLKKDFIIQKQRNQKKNCRLQLQNMQNIYDKMFIASSNLAKLKSKSFKVKKLKTSCLMNSSNRSTIIQIRRSNTQDK